MSDPEDAIEEFLAATDEAFEEYDQGYVDADATLRVIRSHVDDLRETID